jgi:hypothetical protein
MKVFVALLLITLCNALAPGFQSANWIKVDSTVGDFSILMPCEAKENKESKDSQYGPYTSYMFSCTSTEREVFLAGWVDYDPKFIFNPQKELEANRDAFLKGLSATLGTSASLTYRGYQGLEFDGYTDVASFRARVFIIGKRPYMLTAAFLKGNEHPQNIDKFFSSFDPGRTSSQQKSE